MKDAESSPPPGVPRHLEGGGPVAPRAEAHDLIMIMYNEVKISDHPLPFQVCPANWKPGSKTMVADSEKSLEYFSEVKDVEVRVAGARGVSVLPGQRFCGPAALCGEVSEVKDVGGVRAGVQCIGCAHFACAPRLTWGLGVGCEAAQGTWMCVWHVCLAW